MLINGQKHELCKDANLTPPAYACESRGATNREWLGLRELSIYANVSERTLRAWIRSPRDPLPAARVSGKLLVRRSDFDNYMDRHRVQPLQALNLDRIVQDVLGAGR